MSLIVKQKKCTISYCETNGVLQTYHSELRYKSKGGGVWGMQM